MLAVLFAGIAYAAGYLPGGGDHAAEAGSGEPVRKVSPLGEPLSGREDLPEPPDAIKLKRTPASAAYLAVAGELPDVDRESIKAVYRSEDDPDWAAVRFGLEDEEGDHVLFLQKEGRAWEVRRSVLTDEPDYPENEQAVLGGVPEDLAGSLYTVAEAENGLPSDSAPVGEPPDLEGVPDMGQPRFSGTEPFLEGVPSAERGRIEKGLSEVREVVERYDGVAGVYVRDLEGGWGYGVRPDEEFFSASVIKVPIMIAVYRKIDEGELSLSDRFETEEWDWAAGAGWLQWEDPGEVYSVYDYLWMMMTQSDNVATNALLRKVGGIDYVNEVSRSLGTEDTVLMQKVTSERGAVPALDNRTTTRDMVVMMEKIADGTAASPESSQDMVDLMFLNVLDSWLVDGLPSETPVANKSGWLYQCYNEVGIVFHDDRPYAVSVLSKYGPADPEAAKPDLTEISERLWDVQDGGTEGGEEPSEEEG